MSETVAWVAADGSVAPMDLSQGVRVLRNLTGRFSPPARRTRDIVPFGPGSRLRAVQHDTALAALPVMFESADEATLRTSIRAWAKRMDPTLGPGLLRVTSPLGDTRERRTLVVDGLGLDESQGVAASGIYKTVLSLESDFPYWQDSTDTVVDFTGSGAHRTFFPVFPVRLGASDVFNTQSITVDGDKVAYPVWNVTGPGDTLVLTNLLSNRTLRWDGALGDGETLTIDCRPSELTSKPFSVTRGNGADAFVNLSVYDFWPLLAATQTIDVEFTGTTAASLVQLSYRANYLSA